MSWTKHHYHDEICGITDLHSQQQDDWEQEQREDEGYEVVSIDYSNKSWEQFDKDLGDKNSELVKTLAKLGLDPC